MGAWSRDSMSATVGLTEFPLRGCVPSESKHLHCDRPVPQLRGRERLCRQQLSTHHPHQGVGRNSPGRGSLRVETRGLSLYQTVIMAVVESKGSVSDGKKSEGDGSTVFTARGSTGYEVRELVNPAAQRTLLIDSRLEPDSSVYGSYAGESSHYYYPTSDYCPSLYPHPEGAQGQDGRHHPLEPIGREYEEVRGWGMYQDMLGLSLPLPPSQFDPRLPEQRQ